MTLGAMFPIPLKPEDRSNSGTVSDYLSDALRRAMARPPLAYCDYIAAVTCAALRTIATERDSVVRSVGSVKSDLHVPEGYMVSTKKTLDVADLNGKRYRITVEELADDAR